MAALTDYAETVLINAAVRGIAFTPPAVMYLALHTADPTEAGNVAEVAGAGYVRKAVTFAAPVDGVCVGPMTSWTPSGGTFGTVTHATLWDALSGGNPWFKGALSAPIVTANGVQLDILSPTASLA
jgi:hypothetical protein